MHMHVGQVSKERAKSAEARIVALDAEVCVRAYACACACAWVDMRLGG